MAESGAASFTLAVITSPKPARKPRSPPRGRIHCSRRAPLLSATSRMVRMPIIKLCLLGLAHGRWPFLGSWPLAPGPSPLLFRYQLLGSGLDANRTQVGGHLNRFAHYFAEAPALQLAHGAAFNNAPHVADIRPPLFVVGVEFLALGHDSLIERMRDAPRHHHHDGFGHLVRDHRANLFVLVGLLALICRFGVRHIL